MLNKITKVDKYGNKVIDYRLTKGDTFLQNIALKKDNSQLRPDLINKIIFKLGDYDYVWFYEQEYVYDETKGIYKLNIPSEYTSTLNVETYRYQIEVIHSSGKVETIMSAKFTITEEIQEG